MSTTYNPQPEIERYLKRLSTAARDLPKGQRRELLSEIEQHIRDAFSETRVDNRAEMLTLLDQLGDPEEIVAAARGPQTVTRSTTMETWAIILLLIGGFLWGIGWIAGVVLLWSSSIFTLRDKLIGTLVVPGGLASVFFLAFFSFSGSSEACYSNGPGDRWTCQGGPSTLGMIVGVLALAVCVLGPIGTAIYLGRRFNRQKRIYAAVEVPT
jgi:uncharacterized membrane protein